MGHERIAILIPYFNDVEAFPLLLAQLDAELTANGREATLVVVDDGSHRPPDLSACGSALSHRVVVRLRVNQGHQRAIAVGLAYIADQLPHDVVVVMDDDGEDLPSDVERLLLTAAEDPGRIVFAERMRRSEGFAFAIGYHSYRWLHRLLTGESVRFGNFSALPGDCVRRLVGSSQLWNHYAAAAIRSRIPYTGVPTTRGERLGGRSTMNWPALAAHGLSAFAVFSDIIGARLLFGSGLLGGFTALGLAAGAALGWVPWSTALLTILLIAVLGAAGALAFVFIIQAGRQTASVVPARDYAVFILDVQTAGSGADG